jgi:hypothetical protein
VLRDPPSDAALGFLEELEVELCLDPSHEIFSGFEPLEDLEHGAVARALDDARRGGTEVRADVVDDREEPTAETLGRIIAKSGHLP